MYRIGTGYDAHRFVQNRDLVLGGVNIPFKYGLAGWSDADVLCHAMADAVLGAAAAGDIGHYFAPNDPRWKGVSSIELLKKVREIIDERGYEVVNVDSVLIMEEPKVGDYRREMGQNIGAALGIDPRAVGVKATTTEGLGFVGEGQGAAAQAVALIKIKDKK
ncbi:MAG: 2-C-methyl-D-erythritol 2,4-cyclodiphosphate synthase [Actinomycetota bacterium]